MRKKIPTHLLPLREHIHNILLNKRLKKAIHQDWDLVFTGVGGKKPRPAESLSLQFFQYLIAKRWKFPELEKQMHAIIKKSLNGRVEAILMGYASGMYKQLLPALTELTGKGLHIGCGDGRLTRMVRRYMRLDVDGLNKVRYPEWENDKKFFVYEEIPTTLKNFYDFILVTHSVGMSHEDYIEQALYQTQLLKKGGILIVNESAAVSAEYSDEQEKIFMIKYLINRLLHSPELDVQVPTVCPKIQEWEDIYTTAGLQLTLSRPELSALPDTTSRATLGFIKLAA